MRASPAVRRIALCSLAPLPLGACAPGADRPEGDTTVAASAAPANTWAADSAAIAAVGDSITAAAKRRDVDAHLAGYVDTAMFVMPTPAGKPTVVHRSVAAARPTYVKQFGSPAVLQIERLVLRPLGPDAALEVGRYTSTAPGSAAHRGTFTAVWIRTPTGWRIVHDHTA